MTTDEAKLKELIDKINNSPEEDIELSDELFEQLDQEQIVAIYVEKMIVDKGIEPTDELRNELRNQLSDKITENIIQAMPDYLVKQLNEGIDGGLDEDAVNKLIDESGIDVETITEQTMTAFRNKYLEEDK